MSKIAVVTDTHAGARGDSDVFRNYQKRFFSELFFPTLINRGINHIIHCGDIMERRKFINYVTLHEFKNSFIDPIVSNNMTLDYLVGNHDTTFKNTNEINAMTELFGKSHPNINVYEQPTTIQLGNTDVLLLPWICADNYKVSMELIEKTSAQVAFGHLEVYGFQMYKGITAYDHGLPRSMFSKFEIVCSGHYHHKSTEGNVHYLGSPYEMTWNDYDDPRGFHVFDTETRELEFIENKDHMFYKIWYDDTDVNSANQLLEDINVEEYRDKCIKVITIKKNNPYVFDKFLDTIYQQDPFNVTIVDDNKYMDQLSEEDIVDEAEDTLTILDKYCETLDLGCDKQKLVPLLHELYNDAHSIDV